MAEIWEPDPTSLPAWWGMGSPATELWGSSIKTSGFGDQGGVMQAAQMRQPKPSLAIRKGTDLKLELEWSQTLVAEQKHNHPQRPHAPPSALWPQQHFLHGSLMGKEKKWCFGVKNPYLLTLVSGSWSSSLAWVNPRAVCHIATRQYTKAAAVVHHHCLLSCSSDVGHSELVL